MSQIIIPNGIGFYDSSPVNFVVNESRNMSSADNYPTRGRQRNFNVTFPNWIASQRTSIHVFKASPESIYYGIGGNINPPPDPSTFTSITRSTVYEGLRVGVQNVNTTGIAIASIQLNATDIESKPVIKRETRKVVRSSTGEKVLKYRQYSTGKVVGEMSYTDLAYLLSMILCKPDVYEISEGISKFTYFPHTHKPNDFAKLTVERGSPQYGTSTIYLQLSGLDFDITDEQCTLSGDTISVDTEEITSSSTVIFDLEDRPLCPSDINVSIGFDMNNLVPLEDLTKLSCSFANTLSPRWGVDRSNPSFSSLRNYSGTKTISISVTHNSRSFQLLEDMKDGDLNYIFIDCLGDYIIPTLKERLTIAMPFVIIGHDRGDNNGNYEATYTLEPIYNDIFGGWIKADLTNSIPHSHAVELSV